MKLFSLIALLFCAVSLYAQPNDSISTYLKQKASRYLQRDASLSNHYSITNKGVFIYKNANDKKNNSPEFFVAYNSLDSCRAVMKNWEIFDKMYGSKRWIYYQPFFNDSLVKPVISGLKGKKIIIDPGHISNAYIDAKIEGKYLKFKEDSLTPNEVIEGRLTMATTFLLKQKLEEDGATVLLTRNEYGKSSFNQTFNDWLQSDSSGYAGKQLTEAELKKVFSIYNNRDLLNRSEIINQSKSDLCIIIHFNVDEKNLKWQKPTRKNFNMIFMSGAMSKGDLNIRRNRMEFLRLLISNDWEQSLAASKFIIQSFEEVLKVSTAQKTDADYLTEKSISTPINGVYSRNLALCRLSHGALVYGETLYQDNENEYKILSNNNIIVNNQAVSSRVKDVAEAYYTGIKNYFNAVK